MNFSQLQSFVALAETGSFTEAAYTINLTQSAVSHALSALEGELGVTLLERNRKGVVALTNAGKKIMPHVRALLAQAEAIEQEAKVERGLTMGKLRLGVIESIISPCLLASLLINFRTWYPDIEVVLFEGTMLEVGEWIEHSIVDVGFILLPAPLPQTTLITTDELCVLVSPTHRLRKKSSVTAAELRDEGFIMAKNECGLRFLGKAGLDSNKIKQQIRYQATDSATILAMVREGLGITIMPRTRLPKKLEGIVALSLDPPQYVQIGLGLSSKETASPSASLFIQTAVSWVQEQTSPLVAGTV